MEILTSACDKAANSEQSDQLAAQWEQKDPGRVSIYEFPQALGVPHDMIDPNQPDAKTQLTIPKSLNSCVSTRRAMQLNGRSLSHTISPSLKGEAFSGRGDQF
jgi:hypothetical protein